MAVPHPYTLRQPAGMASPWRKPMAIWPPRSPNAIVDEPMTGIDSPNRMAIELSPIAKATTFTKPEAPHACSTR